MTIGCFTPGGPLIKSCKFNKAVSSYFYQYMNEVFSILKDITSKRRNIKPQQMNGVKIPDDQVLAILALADFAPTHGITEPWRFVVYSGKKVTEFCQHHATMYREHTTPEKFEHAKYDKLLHMGDNASHIIIAIMQRGNLPKIPAWEEKAATACAVSNMLLGATALDIASYWGSGGMVQHQSMKTYLGLKEEDFVMGVLYFGYSEKQPGMVRHVPLEEKVKWIK